MKTGQVIILNGVSSSGKTSLARALQEELDQPYLHCSLDAFWNMTPRSIAANSNNFPAMKLAIAHSVRALADTGHNVIVDIILNGQTAHLEFCEALSALKVQTIKVHCEPKELDRRERERGDRVPGLARSQLASTHCQISYDLFVDTTKLSALECATKILGECSSPNSPVT